jgi:uncharacterized membrane protein
MSPLEKRAWLMLWTMSPIYLVYFAVQIAAPAWLTGILPRIACLAAASGGHGVVYVIGLLVLMARERGQGLMADERDHAIEASATRIAYYVLMAGAVLVGMVMPFTKTGWSLVNAALLSIVLAEGLRNLLIVRGYRGRLALAQ